MRRLLGASIAGGVVALWCASSVAAVTFTENFDGPTISPNLAVSSSSGFSFSLVGGEALFEKSSGTGNGSVLIQTRFTLLGDFTATVMATRDQLSTQGEAGMGSFSPYHDDIYFYTNARIDAGSTASGAVTTNSSSMVTFRIRRVGQTVFDEFDDGSGFQTLYSHSGGNYAAPRVLELFLVQEYGNTNYNAVRFDNLSIDADAFSVCGNGIVEGPVEQCDLGTANCPVGQYCASGCTSDCKVIGSCTGNQAPCTTAAECPSGQGCCGNDTVDPGEQCDDGNLQNGDCCSSTCQTESSCVPLPDVCAGTFGPHLIANPTVKKTQLSQSRTSTGGLDTWSTNGQFSLNDGQAIDPDTEVVTFVLNQNNGANQSTNLYAPVLDPTACPNGVCFVPTTNPQGLDLRWTFRRKSKDPDISGAPGWRSGKFSRTAKQTNLVHFLLNGKNTTIGTPQSQSNIRRVRQSIKIGDDCVTRLLDCAPNNPRTRFTCKEAHCGNGIKDKGEQCGEPALPSCPAGKHCDTCVCVTGP